MKKIFETPSFRKDSVPSWPCPACAEGHLTLIEDSFLCQGDSNTELNGRYIDPEDHKYIFMLMMKCNGCKAHVAVSGTGGLEHHQEEEGPWDVLDYFLPTFFQPALHIIDVSINTNIPTSIRESLENSFSLFWCNYDACANRIRATLELLLDEMGVSRRSLKSDDYISLGNRIKMIAGDDQTPEGDAKVLIEALKWLGNAGTHELKGISREQLIEAYKMMEKVLNLLYPATDHERPRLLAKAKAVNAQKKWSPGL